MFGTLSLFYIGAIILRTNGCFAAEDTSRYLPHLEDCSKFYREFQGVRHELQCPFPKLFNAQLKVCDTPEKSGCVRLPNGSDVKAPTVAPQPSQSVVIPNNSDVSQHAQSLESGISHVLPDSQATSTPSSQLTDGMPSFSSSSDSSYSSVVDTIEAPKNFSMSEPTMQTNLTQNVNALEDGISHAMDSFDIPKPSQPDTSTDENMNISSNLPYTGYMPYSHEDTDTSDDIYDNPSNPQSQTLSEDLDSLESGLSHGLGTFEFPMGRPHPLDSEIGSSGYSNGIPDFPPPSSRESIEEIGKHEFPHNSERSLESLESKLSHTLSSFHFPESGDDSESIESPNPSDDSVPDGGYSPGQSSESVEYPGDTDANINGSPESHSNLDSIEHSLSHGLGSLHFPNGLQPTADPDETGMFGSSEENQQESQTSFECPPSSQEEAINMVYPGNCYKFYKCFNGVPEVYDCPAPLQFNPVVGICDEPENVGCSSQNVYSNHQSTPSAPEFGWNTNGDGAWNLPNNPNWNVPGTQHPNHHTSNEYSQHEGGGIGGIENGDNVQSTSLEAGDPHNENKSSMQDDYQDSFSSESKDSGSTSEENTTSGASKGNKKRSFALLSKIEKGIPFLNSGWSDSGNSDGSSDGSFGSGEYDGDFFFNADASSSFIDGWRHILLPVSKDWNNSIQQLSNALQSIPFLPHKHLKQSSEKTS
ncbi:uncharacterized protein LOC108740556 isoform X2 [Agrilus planipennis]|uniref:Uncharacterized protein LOC108740556 isoform X2 n=1 Tax=Agrilus planipennis TaxID=224129 RepID=A0A1W4XDI1_AGRPL|nr:uncharacterized protein LOC108740556 isoform X2 [Agrilus planipennis]